LLEVNEYIFEWILTTGFHRQIYSGVIGTGGADFGNSNVHVWCVKFTEALIICHRAFVTCHVTSVGFTSFIT